MRIRPVVLCLALCGCARDRSAANAAVAADAGAPGAATLQASPLRTFALDADAGGVWVHSSPFCAAVLGKPSWIPDPSPPESAVMLAPSQVWLSAGDLQKCGCVFEHAHSDTPVWCCPAARGPLPILACPTRRHPLMVRDPKFNRRGDCEKQFGPTFAGGPAYTTETEPDRQFAQSCGCRTVVNWPKVSCCPAGKAWPEEYVTSCPE